MFLLLACAKEDAGISHIPHIDFESVLIEKNMEGKDSMVHLTIRFRDGDGDIGLGEDDSLPPFNYGNTYYHNLPIEILYNNNGQFEELLNPIDQEPFELHERIPPITPEGKNKSISGKLTVHLPANPLNTQPAEVKYNIRLIDRALNESNTVSSPIIFLSH